MVLEELLLNGPKVIFRNVNSSFSIKRSILGPLFFLFYINDLPNVSQLTDTLLFADDTSIFYSHPNVDRLLSIMNLELVKFATRMKSNKLSVNLKKSNFVVFRPKRKRIKVPINPKLLFCLNKYMYNSEQNGATIFYLGQNRNFL